MKKFVSLLTLFIPFFLNAFDAESSKIQENNLRIIDLLPNTLIPLGINPKVPENFIAMSPPGKLDPYEWIYWGPKEVLEAYFIDNSSLQTPIFRVKFSSNTVQTGADTFNVEDSIQKMKNLNPNIVILKQKWGTYPVLGFKGENQGEITLMGWVGLNDPESGFTLLFNVVYPMQEHHPDCKDIALWNDFIMNTTPLDEHDSFKVAGQDLQPGYTLANISGIKLKISAEIRESDSKLQAVITTDPNVKIQFSGMKACQLASKWNNGHPLLKVYATVSKNDGNSETIIHQVFSILLKKVVEFSANKDLPQESGQYVYQN